MTRPEFCLPSKTGNDTLISVFQLREKSLNASDLKPGSFTWACMRYPAESDTSGRFSLRANRMDASFIAVCNRAASRSERFDRAMSTADSMSPGRPDTSTSRLPRHRIRTCRGNPIMRFRSAFATASRFRACVTGGWALVTSTFDLSTS